MVFASCSTVWLRYERKLHSHILWLHLETANRHTTRTLSMRRYILLFSIFLFFFFFHFFFCIFFPFPFFFLNRRLILVQRSRDFLPSSASSLFQLSPSDNVPSHLRRFRLPARRGEDSRISANRPAAFARHIEPKLRSQSFFESSARETQRPTIQIWCPKCSETRTEPARCRFYRILSRCFAIS